MKVPPIPDPDGDPVQDDDGNDLPPPVIPWGTFGRLDGWSPCRLAGWPAGRLAGWSAGRPENAYADFKHIFKGHIFKGHILIIA